MLKMTDNIKSHKHGTDTVEGFLDWILTDDRKTARIGYVVKTIVEREKLTGGDMSLRHVLEKYLTLSDLKALLDDPSVRII